MENKITQLVAKHFISSHEYNGISLTDVLRNFYKDNNKNFKDDLCALIDAEKIAAVRDELNPHVKRFNDSSISEQKKFLYELPDEYTEEYEEHGNKTISFQMIKPSKFSSICLYPTEKLLRSLIPENELLKKPKYKQKLCLAEAQLGFNFFKIDVLDRYKSDPRYKVDCYGHGGAIYLEDNYDMQDSDKIFLKNFGLAYIKEHGNVVGRAVCAFTYYLSNLTSEHQQHWSSFELKKQKQEYLPDADFVRTTYNGLPPENIGIFSAFLMEFGIINKITKKAFGKNLFKRDFYNEYLPDFTPFINPTWKSYRAFILQLNKIFSENFNFGFFEDKIEIYNYKYDEHGKRMKNGKKGSITLLQNFFDPVVPELQKKEFSEDVLKIWRDIQSERSKDSHEHLENVYDPDVYKRQSEIIKKAYQSIRKIRDSFSTIPMIQDSIISEEIKIPTYLEKYKIRLY